MTPSLVPNSETSTLSVSDSAADVVHSRVTGLESAFKEVVAYSAYGESSTFGRKNISEVSPNYDDTLEWSNYRKRTMSMPRDFEVPMTEIKEKDIISSPSDDMVIKVINDASMNAENVVTGTKSIVAPNVTLSNLLQWNDDNESLESTSIHSSRHLPVAHATINPEQQNIFQSGLQNFEPSSPVIMEPPQDNVRDTFREPVNTEGLVVATLFDSNNNEELTDFIVVDAVVIDDRSILW